MKRIVGTIAVIVLVGCVLIIPAQARGFKGDNMQINHHSIINNQEENRPEDCPNFEICGGHGGYENCPVYAEGGHHNFGGGNDVGMRGGCRRIQGGHHR